MIFKSVLDIYKYAWYSRVCSIFTSMLDIHKYAWYLRVCSIFMNMLHIYEYIRYSQVCSMFMSMLGIRKYIRYSQVCSIFKSGLDIQDYSQYSKVLQIMQTCFIYRRVDGRSQWLRKTRRGGVLTIASFDSFSTTLFGSGLVPTVKYVRIGTSILPASRSATSSSSSAKRLPTTIAKLKSGALVSIVESFLKADLRWPLASPRTML